jgi:hypothetical protein
MFVTLAPKVTFVSAAQHANEKAPTFLTASPMVAF